MILMLLTIDSSWALTMELLSWRLTRLIWVFHFPMRLISLAKLSTRCLYEEVVSLLSFMSTKNSSWLIARLKKYLKCPGLLIAQSIALVCSLLPTSTLPNSQWCSSEIPMAYICWTPKPGTSKHWSTSLMEAQSSLISHFLKSQMEAIIHLWSTQWTRLTKFWSSAHTPTC